MVDSLQLKQFFAEFSKKDEENGACVECGTKCPQWASVSYGTLFCLQCSGKHRGLGVHISFVRSTTMDVWNEKQLKMMELGGNKAFKEFATMQGIQGMDVTKKYHTKAAEYYRKNLQAAFEGVPGPTELNPGEGQEMVAQVQSEAASNGPTSLSGGTPPEPKESGDPLKSLQDGLWGGWETLKTGAATAAGAASDAMDQNEYLKTVKDTTVDAASTVASKTKEVGVAAYSTTSNVASSAYTATTSAASGAAAGIETGSVKAKETVSEGWSKMPAFEIPGADFLSSAWTSTTSAIGGATSAVTSGAKEGVTSTQNWISGADTGKANITAAAEQGTEQPTSLLDDF